MEEGLIEYRDRGERVRLKPGERLRREGSDVRILRQHVLNCRTNLKRCWTSR